MQVVGGHSLGAPSLIPGGYLACSCVRNAMQWARPAPSGSHPPIHTCTWLVHTCQWRTDCCTANPNVGPHRLMLGHKLKRPRFKPRTPRSEQRGTGRVRAYNNAVIRAHTCTVPVPRGLGAPRCMLGVGESYICATVYTCKKLVAAWPDGSATAFPCMQRRPACAECVIFSPACTQKYSAACVCWGCASGRPDL